MMTKIRRENGRLESRDRLELTSHPEYFIDMGFPEEEAERLHSH